eukprot:427833_1
MDELARFLEHFKLLQYYKSIKAEGADSLDDLRGLNDDEAKQVAESAKLTIINQKKFVRAVMDLRNGDYTLDKNASVRENSSCNYNNISLNDTNVNDNWCDKKKEPKYTLNKNPWRKDNNNNNAEIQGINAFGSRNINSNSFSRARNSFGSRNNNNNRPRFSALSGSQFGSISSRFSSISSSKFGSSPASKFGSSPVSKFGSSSVSKFGSSPASKFGSSSASKFGSISSKFGSISSSKFGSSPASKFGSSSVSKFGSSPASRFGVIIKYCKRGEKGFGFISYGDSSNVFFHSSAVKSRNSSLHLREGQKVKFEIISLKNGQTKAINVYIIGNDLDFNTCKVNKIQNWLKQNTDNQLTLQTFYFSLKSITATVKQILSRKIIQPFIEEIYDFIGQKALLNPSIR